jgi:hypothetical protein
MGLHAPLEASLKLCGYCYCSSRVRYCSAGGVRLSGNCFSAGRFLYADVAAVPLESAALRGGGCSLEFLHNYVAAPLKSAPIQGAAPLEASSTIEFSPGGSSLEASFKIVWLLLLWSPLLYMGQHARWRLPPQLCGCCSSGVRCSTGGCSLEVSSTIVWLLLLLSPLPYWRLLHCR